METEDNHKRQHHRRLFWPYFDSCQRSKSINQFNKDLNTAEREFYKLWKFWSHWAWLFENFIWKIAGNKHNGVGIRISIFKRNVAESLLYFYWKFNIKSLIRLSITESFARHMMIKMQPLKNLHSQFMETLHFEELELLKEPSKDFQRWSEKSREEIFWQKFLFSLLPQKKTDL